MAHMDYDMETADRFFSAYLAGYDGDGWLSFRHRPADGDRLSVDWAPAADMSAIMDVLEKRGPYGDLWFGVGIRREMLGAGKRGGARDVIAHPGLWLDIDIEGEGHKTDEPLPLDTEDALSLLADGPKAPSIVVHSGGGLQPYWLFPEPTLLDRPTLTRWHTSWAERADDHGWALDNVSDVAREMRVPGSCNWKTGEPRPVTIL